MDLWKVQASSLGALPFWYPFLGRTLDLRSKALVKDFKASPHWFFASQPPYAVQYWSRGISQLYRGIVPTLCLQPLFPYLFWLSDSIGKKLGFAPTSPLPVTLASLGVSALANVADVTVICMRKMKVSAWDSRAPHLSCTRV